MRKIVEVYGDLLAHRFSILLESLPDIHDELVFVCPDEITDDGNPSVIDRLVISLTPRLRDRLVVIRVPRTVIDKRIVLADDDATREDAWRHQLRHVANATRRTVFLLDEFNGSNTTAAALLDILTQADVEVYAYLTVLNREPSASRLLGIPVYALYEVPSPRRPRAELREPR